jgi:uncharacterized protein YeeX (DUF496 family)
MNTIGKILVVLNFLFALVMATLVAMNYTTTSNWKNQDEKWRAELLVAHANNAAQAQTLSELSSQNQALKIDYESKKSDIAVAQAELASVRTESDIKIKDAETRAKLSDVRSLTALAAEERMQKEGVQLKAMVTDREGRIVALANQLRDKTDLANTTIRDLNFSQDLNKGLLARNQELEQKIVELQQPGDKTQVVSQDPTKLNPPSRFIKGVVEKVDSVDKNLIKLSVGTDHGVKVGNTMEIYRTNPVQYIGVVRIEDAQFHTSVARRINTPGVKTPEIREGDTAASGLDSRR